MSWDVLIMKVPSEIKTTKQLPKGFEPSPIGSHVEIVEKLLTIFPQISAYSLSRPLIVDGEFSIEVSIGEEDPCVTFTLHVRGGGNPVEAVLRICELFDCRALDYSTGEFLDGMLDPTKGFRQWKAYRDRVVGDSSKEI